MNHPRSRLFSPTVAVLAAGVLAAPTFFGCDSKRTATSTGGPTATGPVKGGEAVALAELDNKPDAAHCRTALQQLDNLDSAAQRPSLPDSDRAEFARFLRLTPAEATEIGQTTFSQTDAAYLEECLLVRSGVKSLRIDARPPPERARLGFEWACRLVYVDDRWPEPTNPWTTLQSGSGIAISRAYVILAVWQQLGLDGCVIGPPDLEQAPSATLPNPADPTSRPTYAPVRACAVKVGPDLCLFDPASGRPVAAPDGKGPLTLAQAKAQPEAVKDAAKPDEVKTWQPFLAPTLAGLSRRMEWLEGFDPGKVGAKLFIDLGRQRAEFAKDLGGTAVGAWAPEGDPFSPGRVLARFGAEDVGPKAGATLRQQYRLRMVPIERLPPTPLAGAALLHLHLSFARPFEMLRYAPGTARDLLVRGQFREATTALDGIKQVVDHARTRIDQDKNLKNDFETWSDQFQTLSAQMIRAQREDPAGVPAAIRELEMFRAQPRNQDIERAFVLGHAARPLGADIAFLTATAVHERAERAQLDGSAQAAAQWANAAQWWKRFLDASAQARSPFPARETHAKALLARCEQFTAK